MQSLQAQCHGLQQIRGQLFEFQFLLQALEELDAWQ